LRRRTRHTLTIAFGALEALLIGSGWAVSTNPNPEVIWATVVLFMVVAAVAFFVVRRLVKRLVRVSAELDSASTEVANAAAQLASTGKMLVENAATQSSELEESSGASVEIASISRQTAERTGSAAETVRAADSVAEEVTIGLEEMMGAMAEIGSSSSRISRVSRVVDEIAFQTNLLALNAAVEAARAGEAGLSFGVVADEVRSLAKRSAAAAAEISTLVDESTAHAKSGGEKLDRVASALGEFLEKESGIKLLIEEVTESSELQAAEMESLSENLTRIEQITQQTSASALQTAATGEQMSGQAASLGELVSTLQSITGSRPTSRREK
jgi:methyl-accepting chemotaxis protein